MNYHVYRFAPNGDKILIAHTTYFEDALACLRNWHSGEIFHKGKRIWLKEEGREKAV